MLRNLAKSPIMEDLFEAIPDEANKIKKVKGNSLKGRNELKVNQRQLNRDLNCLDAIKETGGLPKTNEVSSFISKGMSDAGSFLYAVSELHKTIDEAYIATWTISRRNVEKLIEYYDAGKIKKLVFIINDGITSTGSTMPIYALLRIRFDERSIPYAVVNSHAKIQCYKCGESYYTISGSGNWSENPRIENYILIGGEINYNFTKQWMQGLIK